MGHPRVPHFHAETPYFCVSTIISGASPPASTAFALRGRPSRGGASGWATVVPVVWTRTSPLAARDSSRSTGSAAGAGWLGCCDRRDFRRFRQVDRNRFDGCLGACFDHGFDDSSFDDHGSGRQQCFLDRGKR